LPLKTSCLLVARLTSAQLRLSIWWLLAVVAGMVVGLAVAVLAAIVQPQDLPLLEVRLTQSQSAVVAILAMALILYFLPLLQQVVVVAVKVVLVTVALAAVLPKALEALVTRPAQAQVKVTMAALVGLGM
jgi:hypothetical protein